jgi:hypothetical protein
LAGLVGRAETILVEKPGVGRTPCFVPVHFDGNTRAGALLDVRLKGAGADHLIADLAA